MSDDTTEIQLSSVSLWWDTSAERTYSHHMPLNRADQSGSPGQSSGTCVGGAQGDICSRATATPRLSHTAVSIQPPNSDF